MRPDEFVAALTALEFRDAFNPYKDSCDTHDLPTAPAIRRENLTKVLSIALSQGVDSLWIARDLGYRGGRRTGLALTDEAHLSAHAQLYGGVDLLKATRGQVVAERTASTIWDMLLRINQRVFLWNVFPFHPHEHDEPLSNRCHTRSERNECRAFIEELVNNLKPRHVIAIGRDAQHSLFDLGFTSSCVRHPSYGGQTEFIKSIEAIYELSRHPQRDAQLQLI